MNQTAKIYPSFRWVWVSIAAIGTIALILLAFYNSRKTRQEAVSIKELMQNYPEVQFVTEDPAVASGPAPSAQAQPAPAQVAAPAVASAPAPSAIAKPAVPEPSPAAAVAPKPYAIQLYSFKDLGRAQATLEELKKKDLPAYLMTQDLKEKGIWHKIWVGGYATRDEAAQGLVEMRKTYPDCFIVTH